VKEAALDEPTEDYRLAMPCFNRFFLSNLFLIWLIICKNCLIYDFTIAFRAVDQIERCKMYNLLLALLVLLLHVGLKFNIYLGNKR